MVDYLVMQIPGLGRMRHVTRVQQQTEDTCLVPRASLVTGGQKISDVLELREVHGHIYQDQYDV